MTLASSFPGANQIVAWHAHVDRLSRDPAAHARALRLLLRHERDRLDRYRGDEDRLMFLLGRAMARSMVGRALGVAPDAWTWQEGPHGRPEVGGTGSAVRFNVAHSGGLVVCAVACGRDVGVDVEDLERRTPNSFVVPRYCSPREAADIQRQGEPGWARRFLDYWTLKEAYLKARGLGISIPLAEIEFTLNGSRPEIGFLGSLEGTDARWTFHLEIVDARYLMAIAAPDAESGPLIVVESMPEPVL